MEHYFNTIVISGKIASGKTTLANRLVSEFNAKYISFGTYVRYEATQRGIELSRENLQNLGEYIINKDGYINFTLNVFNHFIDSSQYNNEIIVIEGVRHIEVLKEIKRISRNNVTIFLNTNKNQLYKNVRYRDAINDKMLNKFLCHNVESEIMSIKKIADITLSSLFTDKDIIHIKNFVLSKM